MHRSDRNIGRLILGEQEHLVVAGYLSGAGYHDPVLGTVVVHLQREAGTRIHADALDLEATAHVHRVVPAPGAVHGAVVLGLAALLGIELADQFLDVLHLVLVRNHHGVFGFHDHDVFQTQHRDQFAIAVDQAIARVLGDHVAFEHVAILVLLVHVPDRRPGADIAPAGGHRNHTGQLSLFHHGVVDGVVRAAGEGGRIDQHFVAVFHAALERDPAGVVDVRVVLLQFIQEDTGAEQEHAAVPVIVARLQIALGARFVRLFDELGDALDAIRQTGIGVLAATDVAVAGFGTGRRHAEKHHLTVLGGIGGQRQGALEGFLVFDHMVSRQDQQQLVAAFLDQLHRGDADGGCRVATERLEQQALDAQLASRQLLLDDEAMVLVAHQQRLLHAVEG